jgi:hypothetical protein
MSAATLELFGWRPAWVANSGTPAASQIRWCLVPVQARSTGEDPVRAPYSGREPGFSRRSRRPVDLAGGVQAAQELTVHALHTPAACQSRSRRQAVTLERRVSLGIIRHGTPVTTTNTVAVNAARSLTAGDRSAAPGARAATARAHPRTRSRPTARGHLALPGSAFVITTPAFAERLDAPN